MDGNLAKGSIEELRALGFEGFRSVRELSADCSVVPKTSGIYLVLYLGGGRPAFSPKGTGGFFKGKDPNASISELESKWIDNTVIIYVGQTGKSLNRRISKYMEFGRGMPVGHYGGRYVWQIQGTKDLVVCWKVCPDGIDSRQIEHELLLRFATVHGKLPFANLMK